MATLIQDGVMTETDSGVKVGRWAKEPTNDVLGEALHQYEPDACYFCSIGHRTENPIVGYLAAGGYRHGVCKRHQRRTNVDGEKATLVRYEKSPKIMVTVGEPLVVRIPGSKEPGRTIYVDAPSSRSAKTGGPRFNKGG